ncbi:preprotein translocase subunit YajC, partial [Pirellulaceae bacterium]|nr:preprotein translocase subunit YajC [Pirellulaceae bacterium]
PGSGSLFGGNFWLPMLIIGGVYVLIMMVMPRNDQKKNKEMLSSLKKNDRVITAGGIFGTVMTARKEDPFVTLRIDESTNTRIKVLKTSISRVITGDEKSSDKNATEEEGAKKLPA